MWNTTIHRFWDAILRGLSDMWYRGTLIPMFVSAGTDAEQEPEMSFLSGCALPHCLESLYPLTQIARGDAVPAQVEEELRLFLGSSHPEVHIVLSWARMAALWERRQATYTPWGFLFAHTVHYRGGWSRRPLPPLEAFGPESAG